MWYVIGAVLFILIICIVGAIVSCNHKWKMIKSGEVEYQKLFTGPLHGIVVLDQCELCKEYHGYMLTHEGKEKLDTDWVKAQFNVR